MKKAIWKNTLVLCWKNGLLHVSIEFSRVLKVLTDVAVRIFLSIPRIQKFIFSINGVWWQLLYPRTFHIALPYSPEKWASPICSVLCLQPWESISHTLVNVANWENSYSAPPEEENFISLLDQPLYMPVFIKFPLSCLGHIQLPTDNCLVPFFLFSGHLFEFQQLSQKGSLFRAAGN